MARRFSIRRQWRFTGWFLCLIASIRFSGLSAAEPRHSFAVVGVKLVKSTPAVLSEGFHLDLPPDCGDCSLVSDPGYQGENPREIYFHVRVPANASVIRGIRASVGAADISTVIVEKNRIPFSLARGIVTFDLPVAPRARSSTIEVQTSLEWPGIVLRIEHAFLDRRSGRYATGQFPEIQRAAALNLEFSLREAIQDLKLDAEVAARGLGKIHLMGFDTNNPLGHEDYPPHIHMILRWPHYAGSQAPHYYLSDIGLLLPDVRVTLDGMPHIATTQIGRGVWLPAIDYLAEDLYETLITDDGGFVLRRPGGASCTLTPLAAGDGGFAAGGLVKCSAGAVYQIRASDDTARGEVRATVNSRPTEVYRYDVDTAVLLSAEPPLPKKP
jgi:hypothetical protein